MNVSDRTTAAQLIAMFEKVGAKPPAAVTTAWQDTQKLSKGVRAIGCLPEIVYAAIASALQRGDDPAGDAEVQRILASGQISNGGVIDGVDDIAYSWFREVCAEHADDIVAALAKPFEAAAKTLVNAHQVLGDVPLSDSDTILRIGGDAPAHWAKAQAVVTTITSISRGWFALAEFTGHRNDPIRHQVLRLSAPTYEQWMSQAFEGKPADPWALVILGLDLALPTLTQYAERVDTITQGTQQAADKWAADNRAYMTGRRSA
jgi:hypothetical protein